MIFDGKIILDSPLPCLTVGGLFWKSDPLGSWKRRGDRESMWIDVDRSVKVVNIGSVVTFTKCTVSLVNVLSNLFQDIQDDEIWR